MSLFLFVLQIVGISLSGVMAPGALTAVTMSHGSRVARSGVMVALGHLVVEFPLMVALYYGFGALLEVPIARAVIGTAGGLVLVWMGVGMIRRRDLIGDGQVAPPALTAACWCLADGCEPILPDLVGHCRSNFADAVSCVRVGRICGFWSFSLVV